MERRNHHWTDHLDYAEGHDHDDGQEGKEQAFRLPRYENFDPDYDEQEYDEAAEEEVDHRTDEAADDAEQSDFCVRFGWRSKALHRRGRGRFVPLDTREFMAPVFVRRAGHGAKARLGQEAAEPDGIAVKQLPRVKHLCQSLLKVRWITA